MYLEEHESVEVDMDNPLVSQGTVVSGSTQKGSKREEIEEEEERKLKFVMSKKYGSSKKLCVQVLSVNEVE
jgi:hypothetical protein